MKAPTLPRAKRVLMIAFHFPPMAGSSGIQRTLRFVQHLPRLGWEPAVLSAHPRAYERTGGDLLREIPPQIRVERAWAWDTARQLSIAGRHLSALARPDRWMTWQFDAVRRGKALIREFKPDVIWSTFPLATAHIIGAKLQAASGLPWIADFRDPMAQPGYPREPRLWQAYSDIESLAVDRASSCTFTTPGAASTYRLRYPAHAAKMVLLENGYDEESFAGLPAAPAAGDGAGARAGRGPVLLHSGIVYPSERDPTQLFAALRLLCDRGGLRPGDLTVRFRAAVHDGLLRSLAAQYRVQEFIDIVPSIDYRSALVEMTSVDGLLVMQAANCNEQIPAKVYEYLRAGRPILCLTDPAGDTAATLAKAGVHAVARLDVAAEIAERLAQFVSGRLAQALPDPEAVKNASRMHRTRQLAGLLDSVAAS